MEAQVPGQGVGGSGEAKGKSGGYWDDIQGIIDEIDVTHEKAQLRSDEVMARAEASAAIEGGSPIIEESDANKVTPPSVKSEAEMVRREQRSHAASPAVASEIEALRYKYLVDKLSGRDLLDSRGQVIIAKGRPITREVVDAAEAEGKLAELIVYMTLPGLDENL